MKRKKAYVSPQVIRVKLEATQAVLSQCELGVIGLSQSDPTGFCSASKNCKQRRGHTGNSAATS